MKSLTTKICALIVLTGLTLTNSLSGQDVASEPIKLKCDDGFELDGVIDLTKGVTNEEVKRVIILVPGSGAHSMDVDLSSMSKRGQKNLVFKTIGAALASSEFAVVRYNKRNYQVRELIKTAPDAEDTRKYRESLLANPLKHFVDDVLTIASTAKKRFPNADIYLLGHSEGTYVSLQAANQSDLIQGVGLIGFAEYSTDTLAFIQTVYRPLYSFNELDKNSDAELDEDELNVDATLAKGLKAASAIIDADKNGLLSRTEFQAVSLANLLVQDTFGPFRLQEAKYPRVAEILKSAKFKVAFFQGMLDNQTPAYHAMAFEILLKQLGQAGNMQFHYFPGLGHALDPRENYQDNVFSPIDEPALKKMTSSLDEFFRKGD